MTHIHAEICVRVENVVEIGYVIFGNALHAVSVKLDNDRCDRESCSSARISGQPQPCAACLKRH